MPDTIPKSYISFPKSYRRVPKSLGEQPKSLGGFPKSYSRMTKTLADAPETLVSPPETLYCVTKSDNYPLKTIVSNQGRPVLPACLGNREHSALRTHITPANADTKHA